LSTENADTNVVSLPTAIALLVLEAGSWILEAGNWKLEAGYLKLEARS
jgi:hypothetical protein